MAGVPYNKLLTNLASSSRTGEYWPPVVFVLTSLRSVRTTTSSGHYSPVRPSRSVSKRLISRPFQRHSAYKYFSMKTEAYHKWIKVAIVPCMFAHFSIVLQYHWSISAFRSFSPRIKAWVSLMCDVLDIFSKFRHYVKILASNCLCLCNMIFVWQFTRLNWPRDWHRPKLKEIRSFKLQDVNVLENSHFHSKTFTLPGHMSF